MITQSELKSLLHYSPDTGVFTWVVRRSGIKANGIAGSIHHTGYIHIKVKSKLYAAHRLAWLYIHGSFPVDGIDHINGVRNDNRIINLRPATKAENGFNQGMASHNSSGYKGVSWHKRTKKWFARCNVNGKTCFIGCFDRPEDASLAYQNFARINHGEFFNNREIL
jgi:hypothetical protein